MSERKGGPHKISRKAVKISPEHNEKLIAMALAAKNPTMTKRDLAEYLIDLCAKYNLERPGWRARFDEGLDEIDDKGRRSRFDELDKECPAFQLVDEFYVCVWASRTSTPKVKKLSRDMTQALKICEGCAETREILEGIAGYEETIRNLRARARQGIVVSIPRCDLPSELNDDGLSFYCRRQTIKMTVEKCKTLRKGQPCINLKWMNVPVKGDFPDAEDNK